MAHIFYDHLIPWELVDTYIAEVELDGDERVEFVLLVDEVLHHEILLVILESIPTEHHTDFLGRFHEDPADAGHLVFLESVSVKPVEPTIREIAEAVLRDLLADEEYSI